MFVAPFYPLLPSFDYSYYHGYFLCHQQREREIHWHCDVDVYKRKLLRFCHQIKFIIPILFLLCLSSVHFSCHWKWNETDEKENKWNCRAYSSEYYYFSAKLFFTVEKIFSHAGLSSLFTRQFIICLNEIFRVFLSLSSISIRKYAPKLFIASLKLLKQ